MTSDSWFRFIEYSLNIVIVLSLVFALVESSRKYDKFKQRPQLIIASGYFLLIIWALFRSMGLETGYLTFLTAGSQILGLLVLAVGYSLHSQHTEEDNEAPATADDQSDQSEKVEEEPGKKDKESVSDWVTLLSEEEPVEEAIKEAVVVEEPAAPEAGDEAPALPQEVVEAQLKDNKQEERNKKEELPAPIAPEAKIEEEKTASLPTETETSAIDLSHLTKRSQEKAEKITNSTVSSKKKTSKLVSSKPVQPSVKPKKTRRRAAIMDDLFPVDKPKEAESLNSQPIFEPETSLPGEHREEPVVAPVKKTTPKKAKKTINPLAFLAPGAITADQLSQLIPLTATSLLLVSIIFSLWHNRHHRGGRLLLAGFSLLLLTSLAQIILLPSLTADQGPSLIGYLISLGELISFIIVGAGSWAKIKGKITQHFLTIVGFTYLALLALTLGLSLTVVKDESGFYLLTLFSTGLLIIVLPIIHALAYNHPVTTQAESVHD